MDVRGFSLRSTCTLNQICTHLAVSPTGSVSTSPKALLITAGDSLSIKCSAEGGPDNVFHWSHNGRVLANRTTSFLNMTALAVENLGNYTCVVTNVAGNDSSTSTIHGNFLTSMHKI